MKKLESINPSFIFKKNYENKAINIIHCGENHEIKLKSKRISHLNKNQRCVGCGIKLNTSVICVQKGEEFGYKFHIMFYHTDAYGKDVNIDIQGIPYKKGELITICSECKVNVSRKIREFTSSWHKNTSILQKNYLKGYCRKKVKESNKIKKYVETKAVIDKSSSNDILDSVGNQNSIIVKDKNCEYVIKITGKKYHIFKNNKKCVVCGMGIEFCLIEKMSYSDEHFLTFYGTNRENKKVKFTLDHIIPLSKGGTNHKSNLQTMCFDCNLSKGNRLKWGNLKIEKYWDK